jgi:2-methylcitrate dehydratase PrpD
MLQRRIWNDDRISMMNITLGILSILLVGHLPATTANGTASPDDNSKHTLKHCLQTLTALHDTDTAHHAQQSREKPRRLCTGVGGEEERINKKTE